MRACFALPLIVRIRVVHPENSNRGKSNKRFAIVLAYCSMEDIGVMIVVCVVRDTLTFLPSPIVVIISIHNTPRSNSGPSFLDYYPISIKCRKRQGFRIALARF